MNLRKIISGGQTGADQAGLDAARDTGIETGGTAPGGFITEAGSASLYLRGLGLVDTHGLTLRERTIQNIKDSDATVVFGNTASVGSALTIKQAARLKKPCLSNPRVTELVEFLQEFEIEVLNVAGNRHSVNPSLYPLVYQTVTDTVKRLKKS